MLEEAKKKKEQSADLALLSGLTRRQLRELEEKESRRCVSEPNAYATDVELVKVTADACVAAMENGEIAAALLSDTFAYAMVKDGKLKCIRSQQDTDFADRTCCVLAMSGQFVQENPTIAKKVAQAVQKAHSWMRDNSAEATQVLMDMGWNGGNYEMNIMINNALQFGLSDEFTGATLKDFIERYVRLGLITSMDDTDEILNLAWTPIL